MSGAGFERADLLSVRIRRANRKRRARSEQCGRALPKMACYEIRNSAIHFSL